MAPTAKDVADVMLSLESPVVTVPKLSPEFDCSDEHLRKMLHTLHLADEVGTMEAGANARVWWHVDRVTPPVAPEEDPDQTSFADHADAEPAERDVDRETTDESRRAGEGLPDDLADDLDAIDRPATSTDEKREAVRACYQLLRREGAASRKDFIDAVRPDHPAGYGSEQSWWVSISDTLGILADRRDDFRPPNDGRSGDKWEFVAE